MRHLLGVFLAVIMAAAIFFAATWGFAHMTARPAPALTSPHGLAALGALAGTGLLLGLLLCVPWVSPLATGLPGLVLLGWTGALVANSHRALSYIPLQSHSFGYGFHTLLASGLLALAGAAMIIPLFVPSRWRRYRAAEAESEEDLALSGTTTSLLS